MERSFGPRPGHQARNASHRAVAVVDPFTEFENPPYQHTAALRFVCISSFTFYASRRIGQHKMVLPLLEDIHWGPNRTRHLPLTTLHIQETLNSALNHDAILLPAVLVLRSIHSDSTKSCTISTPSPLTLQASCVTMKRAIAAWMSNCWGQRGAVPTRSREKTHRTTSRTKSSTSRSLPTPAPVLWQHPTSRHTLITHPASYLNMLGCGMG